MFPSYKVVVTFQIQQNVINFVLGEIKCLLSLQKYHGLGNDFILIDNRSSSKPVITPEQAVKL